MKTLKFKIYDVLANNITVEEFENYIYNLVALEDILKENSLIFNIIDINYRSNNAKKILKNIANEIFDADSYLVLKIEDNCKKIVNEKPSNEIVKYVLNIIDDFDFAIESHVYWDFYTLYNSFNGYGFNMCSKKPFDKINLRTFNYAKEVLNKLENCKNLEEKKKVVFDKKEETNIKKATTKPLFKHEKQSFNQKIFAFFKKS